jgi:hypothetical protein
MKNRLELKIISLALVFTFLFFVEKQSQVFASAPEQEFCNPDYDWNELEMGAFVLVFPLEQTGLAQEIFTNFPDDLEILMADYKQVFGAELVLPVTIRIYPTHTDYYCLNPLAVPIGTTSVHAHIGEREIALFGNLMQVDSNTRGTLIVNGLRNELAALFAEELSGGHAPTGLLMGLGGYTEDPAEIFVDRYEAAGSPVTPELSWQVLWEGEADVSEAGVTLQATSTVAYLVDVHGWGKFIRFLEQINLQQGYRQALIEVYGANVSQIQSHWLTYFPHYASERWQVNIFHNYDLDAFQELISAGAYQDSIVGLTEAVDLLHVLGDPERLSAAKQLLAQAELGAEAGELTEQSRHMLLSGRYLESYTSAELALEYYSQLGDTRRVTELQAYMAVAKEILDLRAGLEVIRDQGIGINPLKSQEVFEIGQRLMELGDGEGVQQAETILFILGPGHNTFFQFIISVVVLVSTGLIARRVLTYRKRNPPEVDLL